MLTCDQWLNLGSQQWDETSTCSILADVKCIVQVKKYHSVLVTCSQSPSALQNLSAPLICWLVLWIFQKWTYYAESSNLFGTTPHSFTHTHPNRQIINRQSCQLIFHKIHLENISHCTGEIVKTQRGYVTLLSSHRNFKVELVLSPSPRLFPLHPT